MIIGIGSDLIDIRRVAKVIERHGERFLDRIFTDAERAKAERRAKNQNMVVATYAKRFAAKEACSKALGTGIRQGVWWRDMGVINLPGGRPTMHLTGGALARLEGFACFYGADFYGLPRNSDTIRLVPQPWEVPARYPFGAEELVPLRAGERIAWRLDGANVA